MNCIEVFQYKNEIIKILKFYTGMKNISISCALVCLILLCSAALIGTFGIWKHQLSAILVTGVMYLLAGNIQSYHIYLLLFQLDLLLRFQLDSF